MTNTSPETTGEAAPENPGSFNEFAKSLGDSGLEGKEILDLYTDALGRHRARLLGLPEDSANRLEDLQV